MTDLLFDPPWYLLIGLALAGVVLLYNGLSRQAGGIKWAGVTALGLAVVWLVLGRLVETGTERVVRETKELAAAVDKRDWKAFSALLDPRVRFAFYNGREALTAGAAKSVELVGVHDITLTDIVPAAEPGGYTVTFTATADIDKIGHRGPTNWKFLWIKDRNSPAYLLADIKAMKNEQFGTDAVTENLAKP